MLQRELQNLNISSSLQQDSTPAKRNLLEVNEESYNNSPIEEDLFQFIPLDTDDTDQLGNITDTNNAETSGLALPADPVLNSEENTSTPLMSGWGNIFPDFSVNATDSAELPYLKRQQTAPEALQQRQIPLQFQAPVPAVPNLSETNNPIDLAVNYLQNQPQDSSDQQRQKRPKHRHQKSPKSGEWPNRAIEGRQNTRQADSSSGPVVKKNQSKRIVLLILAGFVMITITAALSLIYFGEDPNRSFKKGDLPQNTASLKTTKRVQKDSEGQRKTQGVDIEEAKHTLKSNPRKEARKLFSEGKAACAIGQYSHCRDIMREVITLNPKHPEAYKLLVIATEKLSNTTPPQNLNEN